MSRRKRSVIVGIMLTWLPSLAPAALQLGDFDVVAFKWNTGESATDTLIGVLASPAPVNDGAVNLMLRDNNMPVYITEGPTGGGIVRFGFVDETNWTPANGDGNDISTGTTIGDRVFATVDETGYVELISAANLMAGVVLATATVTLDPNEAFGLVIEDDEAIVYYGDEEIADGWLFVTTGTANPANLGNDLVISVLSGPMDAGTATINNLARDPKLRVSWFPRVVRAFGLEPVMRHFGFDPQELYMSTGIEILTTTGTADLAIYLTNVGTFIANNVQVELSVPPGVGMSIIGSSIRDYGDIASGASTVRSFRIETSRTAVGVYFLTLTASGGISQTLETSVAVWDVRPTILDLAAGRGTVSVSTPFNDMVATMTAPEIILSPDEPYFFDFQDFTWHIVHKEPFYGVHWGDALTTDPVLISPVRPLQDTVDLHIIVLTHSNDPMPGFRVKLVHAESGRIDIKQTDHRGIASFTGWPSSGHSRLNIVPPKFLRKFYNRKYKPYGPLEPGSYADKFYYPDIPASASCAPNSPPANAQGLGGKRAGKRASAPAGTPAGGGKKKGRSVEGGIAGGIVTGVADTFGVIALAPTGPFAIGGCVVASAAATGAGVYLGVLAGDPVGQDLLFVAQENTVPLDPLELTTEERVEMIIAIDAPVTTPASSTMSTAFAYARITDRRTYTYLGVERLTLAPYFPLVLETDKNTYDVGEDILVRVSPRTSGGLTLRGPDVLVKVYLISDPVALADEGLLNDDGQGADAAANDGTYSGILSTARARRHVRLVAWVARTGFFQEEIPPTFGWAIKDLVLNTAARSWKLYK